MISKYIQACTKYSMDLRSYCSVIRLEQKSGEQHYVHTNGFHLWRLSLPCRESAAPEFTTLIPIDVTAPLTVDYPAWREVIQELPSTCPDEAHVHGANLIQALSRYKVTAKSQINPTTLEISESDEGKTLRAKPIADLLGVIGKKLIACEFVALKDGVWGVRVPGRKFVLVGWFIETTDYKGKGK